MVDQGERRSVKGIKLEPSGVYPGAHDAGAIYEVMRADVRAMPAHRKTTFAEKPPTESEILAGLRPYAEAVGQANIEWNRLQEWFSAFFCQIFGPSREEAFAAWSSIASDRAQRGMLQEVAKVKFIARSANEAVELDATARAYELYDGIAFLLKQATNFEDVRNNAIHAPLRLTVAPDHMAVSIDDTNFRGATFIEKMTERNTGILDELTYLRKSLVALNFFASDLWHSWVKEQSLPKIPRMPHRAPQKNRKRSPQKTAPK